MSYFTIVTDSSCDLSASLAEQMHIRVIPLSVFVDGKQHYNFLDGSDISFEDFYAQLNDGAMVTTSAINVGQVKTVFESELMCGHDVLYLGFSSALSGTYNAAVNAAARALTRFAITSRASSSIFATGSPLTACSSSREADAFRVRSTSSALC